MSEYRNLSNLPDDPAYWDALEARVLEGAMPGIRTAAQPQSAWAPLAERAGALVGLASAAALAAMLLAPPRPGPAASAMPGLLRIPRDDPTLAAFLTSPQPPPVVTLVLQNSRRNP